MLNKTNGYNALMRFLRELYHEINPEALSVIKEEQFLQYLERLQIEQEIFTVENFRPGSSGASDLYRRLMEGLSASRN